MVSSLKSLLLVVCLAVKCAPSLAARHERRQSTHASIQVSRSFEIEAYHPASTFETFGTGIDLGVHLQGRSEGSINSTALAFIQSHLGVNATTVGYNSGYTYESARFAYVKQHHEGIPFVNAVANVAWKDGKVVAFGSSFIDPKSIASSKATIEVESAIWKAEEAFEGKYNGYPTGLEYLARPDGSAALVHTIQIQDRTKYRWFDVYVDAHSGDILSATDFSVRAAYNVVPIWESDLSKGEEYLLNPQDMSASPRGWHEYGSTKTEDTSGNNAIVYINDQSTGPVHQSSPGLLFNYPYNVSTDPTTDVNTRASRTNAFYIANSVHDILYRYGFTEESFNFQMDNFGKAGAGNDRVEIRVQDPIMTDNAIFNIGPEGQQGLFGSILLFDLTTPWRDGAMANDVLVHEMTHGLTVRLTGGGTAKCLTTDESRGLGEGWSDSFAGWVQHLKSAQVHDVDFAAYALGRSGLGRRHPYSTNTTTNPLLYADIKGASSHQIGEVWANILHNVYAALIDAHGWSSAAQIDSGGSEGNVLFLHLFINSLRIVPCTPTFVNVRDAWLQEDLNRYAGANKCLLWKIFASKGLGSKAQSGVYSNDFSVVSECL